MVVRKPAREPLPEALRKAIGRRIASMREARKMSREDLAFRLDIKGRNTIYHWETGRDTPLLDTLFYVAKALRCTVWDLLPEWGEA